MWHDARYRIDSEHRWPCDERGGFSMLRLLHTRATAGGVPTVRENDLSGRGTGGGSVESAGPGASLGTISWDDWRLYWQLCIAKLHSGQPTRGPASRHLPVSQVPGAIPGWSTRRPQPRHHGR